MDTDRREGASWYVEWWKGRGLIRRRSVSTPGAACGGAGRLSVVCLILHPFRLFFLFQSDVDGGTVVPLHGDTVTFRHRDIAASWACTEEMWYGVQ